MDYLKKFFSNRGAGDCLLALAGGILLAAVILYSNTGAQPAFRVTVSAVVIAVAVLAIVAGIAAAVLRWELLYYVVYLLALQSFLQFIVSQLRYISNVLVAIDGTVFTTEFLATFILFALGWIMALAAAILFSVRCRKSVQVTEEADI